ncbi:MAG: bifunctional folylpolyglutamate synthase/dihydrofolate synthase [Alphaproteobacteria bacterium]
MYQADLNHFDTRLKRKLEQLYQLSRGTALDLGFRPPYLKLLEAFGNPHLHLPPVFHVAGTNGKGSTIAFLKAILEAAGYSVHAYTSPHLYQFNERIVLNGRPIDDEALEALIDEALALNDGAQITFFEITTAMAFAAFQRCKADAVLLEVGLGGRMDCTNIIPKPYVSIINRVSYDHMEFLGETIEEIAREKAGIIKYETPCIVNYQSNIIAPNSASRVVDIIRDEARDKKVTLYCGSIDWHVEPIIAPAANTAATSKPEDAITAPQEQENAMLFRFGDNEAVLLPQPALSGLHQLSNAGAALAALEVVKDHFPVSLEAKAQGLKTAHWPARLERIDGQKLHQDFPAHWTLYYDGGHNDSAGEALAHFIAQLNTSQSQTQGQTDPQSDPYKVHMILGMKQDKKPESFLSPILEYLSSIDIVPLDGLGGCITLHHIDPILQHHPHTTARHSETIRGAIENILRPNDPNTAPPRIVLICGSLYLAEKIYGEMSALL